LAFVGRYAEALFILLLKEEANIQQLSQAIVSAAKQPANGKRAVKLTDRVLAFLYNAAQ
jgi:hypothetical protein